MLPDSPRTAPGLTLATLALGAIAFALLQSLVGPALPEIQRDLGASPAAGSWILTSYLLSASIATPVVGRLGDTYGKERLLLLNLVALGVGTVVSALATSIDVLIVGRVIQGVGGGIFPLAFGIVRDEFPEERVAGGIGVLSALLGIGAGAGVVLAGVIVEHLSYHFLFWIPLVAIVVALVATHQFVPESPIRSPTRISWPAAFLMSLGLAAVLVGVSQASTWGWGDPRTIGVIVAGLVVVGVWIRTEAASDAPLVDMQMMRIRGVWTTNLAAALIGVGMYSSFILLPQFVQAPRSTGYGFGASIVEAGVFLLPSTVAMLIVGSQVGRLERRFGSKATLVAGAVFAGASYLLLAVAHAQEWQVYLASTLQGVGVGLAFAALANLIVENVRPDQTGVATGMNTVMRTLGGAVGGQVCGTFLAGDLLASGLPSEASFTVGFAICLGAIVVGILAALRIPGGRTTVSSAPGRVDGATVVPGD